MVRNVEILIGVAPRAINEIVFIGQSDTFWHGIQVGCDFRVLAKGWKDLTTRIKPTE